MTRITNLSHRPEELLPRVLVVSMIRTVLSDSEIAGLNASGIERFGEAYAAMLAEPVTYHHAPERFLAIFAQSYVGEADTIEDALKLAVAHIGWKFSPGAVAADKEGTSVSDLLSWDGDALREELEKHFMFLPGDTSWFVFDRNVLDVD